MTSQIPHSKTIKIAFTGHRDIDLSSYCLVRQEIKNSIEEIISKEQTSGDAELKFVLVLGNAIGADKIAINVCDELKNIDKYNIESDIRPSKGYKSKDYDKVATEIISNAKYLIAVWDGTFNNKVGGTSDIVERFGKNSTNLKHIKCDRLSNHKVVKAQSYFGFKFALGIFILFFLFDVLHLGGLSSEFASKSELWFFVKESFFPALLPALSFFGVYLIYKKSKNIKNLFLEFIFPLGIAFYTLVTGYYGFRQIVDSSELHLFNHGDAIFAAANLLTLNSSIFNSSIGKDGTEICLWLVNARILGGFFLAYAFFIAFSFATGRENIDRLKFWWIRFIIRKPYIVIIGDSRKALHLATHSANTDQKVVFLYNGDHEQMEEALDEKDIIFMKGSSTSRFGLNKTHFQKADKVFILHNNDELNFRAAQEMIEIQQENQDEFPNGDWLVHLSDLKQRDLLMSIKHNLPKLNIQCFDIYQNMARKLIFKNDQKALADATIIMYQAVFFGFNRLVEEFMLQYLRVGHFTGKKQLQIKVYYQAHEKTSIHLFQNKYDFLFPEENTNDANCRSSDAYQKVVQYTFFNNGSNQLISFEKMPESESGLIEPQFSLYKFLQKDSAVYIYSCLENGIKSSALLSTLLPRIAFENKSTYLKVYSYYNYLDHQEELNIQTSLCEKTQCRIPVQCFGNDLVNCTASEIENKETDMLAKYFAYFYKELYDGKNYEKTYDDIKDKKEVNTLIFKKVINNFQKWSEEDIQTNWLNEPEMHKDSNRQAADHAEIKLGLMNKVIEDENINFTSFWNDDEVKDLSEIEHIRWNAEKLLLGWIPIDNESEWKKNKNLYKQQKMHHWLKEFHFLTDIEKDKDRTQILGLPYFFNIT